MQTRRSTELRAEGGGTKRLGRGSGVGRMTGPASVALALGKQPWAREPLAHPVRPQEGEQRRVEHHRAPDAALAAANAHEAGGRIDVPRAQVQDLKPAQARGVGSHQEGVPEGRAHRPQHARDLVAGEHRRRAPPQLRPWHRGHHLGPPQRHPKQERQRGDVEPNRRRRPTVLRELEQEDPNVLDPHLLGRPPVVLDEPLRQVDVSGAG